MSAKARPSTSGVLILDKPAGMSSMQAVAAVRRRAGGAKCGHAGTLDPLATGVLIIALGTATKSIDRIMATDKRYATTFDLSAFTTTDDREGEPREVAIAAPPARERIERTLAQRFQGEIMQRPPAFSAIKVAGRRAYKLARRGDALDLPPRPVVIHSISIVAYDFPNLTLDMRCGKGTYIRSLARDLGEALGTGGHCASIRRTAVGPFDVSMAIALDDVPDPLTEEDLLNIDDVLARLAHEPRPRSDDAWA